MAVKPFMGAIKEPSIPHYNDAVNGIKAPDCKIQLEYAFGYRTKDMRNNLRYLKKPNSIAYNTAGVGIVHDTKSNTQSFFLNHIDDITAFDLHPDGVTIATGEIGAKPWIYVWNSDTKEIKSSFKGVIIKGVAAIAFSKTGKLLAAAGVDVDHYVAVFDWQAKSTVCLVKSGPDVIVDMAWKSDTEFVCVGPKNYQYWTVNGKDTKPDKGSFNGNCNMLATVTTSATNIYTGAADGSLQIWNGK